MKKKLALLLSAAAVFGILAGCGQNPSGQQGQSDPGQGEAQPTPDTIVIMAPPVTANYLENLRGWAADFNELYPHLTVEIVETSWGDHTDKLSTMAQSGGAPDIAEVSSNAIGKYVEMGVAIDIGQYLSAERLSDYDRNALDYMTLEGTVYGLPLYLTIQAIGANKTLMEELNIDVADIQNNGWDFDRFLEVIETGTADGRYGFVFANSGVTATDMLQIFGAGAGLSNTFTEDLKYTFTSENMLILLQSIEKMIQSGYMPNHAVEAGQRMVMCQTGNAMIFGKAMPLFEGNFNRNNAALEAGDGSAVENSLPMEYAFLPVPTMAGSAESCYGTVDGLIAMRNKDTTEEHLANVVLFMDYLCSGERIAACDAELYLDPVCESGRAAAQLPEDRDAQNLATAQRCIAMVQAPPSNVTAELNATASQLMAEQIVPKFQLLLSGEATAQEVYDHICSVAAAAFGADGCVSGRL